LFRTFWIRFEEGELSEIDIDTDSKSVFGSVCRAVPEFARYQPIRAADPVDAAAFWAISEQCSELSSYMREGQLGSPKLQETLQTLDCDLGVARAITH
jgi:hypothetical protein